MAKKRKPWRKKATEFYPLHQSPFYKLQSKKKLGDYLHTNIRAMRGMTDKSVRHYDYWNDRKKDGSLRPLCRPHEGLDKVQSRIAFLLQSLQTPDHVQAPVPKRTYVTNAAKHRGANAFCLMDLDNFYPSCREDKVLAFFRHRMKCSLDVATILARLCCDKGCLPQGSPSSPILSYWVYSEMWDAIAKHCHDADNTFTLYIDDLTISGRVVLGETLWKVRQEVHKHDLKIKTSKTRCIVGRPADVTGVIVDGDALRFPNRHHQKLIAAKANFSRPGGNRVKKANRLKGRIAQKAQVLAGNEIPFVDI